MQTSLSQRAHKEEEEVHEHRDDTSQLRKVFLVSAGRFVQCKRMGMLLILGLIIHIEHHLMYLSSPRPEVSIAVQSAKPHWGCPAVVLASQNDS